VPVLSNVRQILDIFRLIRVVNCVLAMAGVFLGAYLCWLEPVYYSPFVSALAAFFVCAAGNVMNGIIDIPIDRINRPQRVLVKGTLSVRFARILAGACSILAIVCACAVNTAVLITVLAALLLLTLYNLWLKKILIVGNIVIAILSSLTFMTGGWAVDYKLAMVLPGPLIPAVYALLFHLVREILKDAEDVEGDRQIGVQTLPQVIGVSRSLMVGLIVFFVLAILTYIPILAIWFGATYEIIMVYIVDLPILAVLILVWGNPTPRMLRAGSICLKLGMGLGMVALLLG
jgi:geranylgeranylglycerol-phosphate geranylgeranyltransferase